MKKTMVKLGEVASYTNGYAFKPEDRGSEGLPIIRIQDLTGNSYDLGYYSGNYPKKIEINDGDILISWSASLGIYIWNKGKALLNQHIFKVEFIEDSIDKKYFVYAVRKKIDEMIRKSHGATMKHIIKKDFEDTIIPYPTLEEQYKIADELDRISKIIDIRKQELESYDDLIRARFVEQFGDPVRNSKNWNTEKLRIIAPINKYNGDIDTVNGKVWLLNLDMIESCTGNIVDFLYEFENRITSSTIKFDENCVLYSKLRPYLNKVVIPERKGYATSELVYMSKEKINKYFLANLLRQDSFVNFSNATAYGAKMPRASMDLIKNFDVINPPTELQNQFGKLVIEVDKSKVEVQRALDEAQLLFDSLMQKYFG